jgi:hypothetical protein
VPMSYTPVHPRRRTNSDMHFVRGAIMIGTRQFRVSATVAALFLSLGVFAGPPRSDHPILGAWNLTAPGSSCVERGIYGADSRYRATSGQEISVSEYSISSEPSEKGFYKFVDVIVETNGLPDCAGNVTPVGDVATNYLRFGDGNNDFMMCQEENMRSCFVMARRAPTS